jgi:hypothetical protein
VVDRRQKWSIDDGFAKQSETFVQTHGLTVTR